MATMRAVVYRGDADFGLEEVPVPEIKRGDDVLLRVQAAGICGTDVHIVEPGSTFPTVNGTVLGHEYTGVVEEIGPDVRNVAVGDRVVVEPNIPCLTCVYCRKAMPNQCLNMIYTGLASNGGWAELNVMPARMLYKVPEGMSIERAALAEPVSCVLGGTAKVHIDPGDTVVVLGAGPIGLIYQQIFQFSGADKVIVVEPHPARADIARTLGATEVLNPREEDVAAYVKSQTGIGADVVVDTVGNQVANALKLVRKRGTVLLFGMMSGAVASFEQLEFTFREIRIQGTLIGTYNMNEALKLLDKGVIDTDTMISHHLSIAEAEAAIGELRAGRGCKILLYPDR
jgi:(R,R)-butanediol dehydrogenase/meso-butanediol dehydrogenase/diacetyl reductase